MTKRRTNRILYIIIFVIIVSFITRASAQVGTGNISMTEVQTEMGFPPTNYDTMTEMVTKANATNGWDPTYSGSKNSLQNFRGYNNSGQGGGGTSPVLLGYNALSSSSACNASSATYYIPSGQSWNTVTAIYKNSAGTTPANNGNYSDGFTWKYWNGSSITSSGDCNF